MSSSSTTPLPADEDDQYLRLLRLFHFIFTFLQLIGTGFLLWHYQFVRSLFQTLQHKPTSTPITWSTEALYLTSVIYFFLISWLILITLLNLFSAISIGKRKNRMLSLITAGLNSIQPPFGTALGIFTIIVLCRNNVRAKYDQSTARMD